MVDDPEGRDVVEEAKAEADDDRKEHAEHEGGREGRRGVVEVEDERADQERRDAAEDEVERRAPEVERKPVALRVERPREVGGDRAVTDPQGELVPAEDVDGHDQRLRQPDVGDRVADVVAADVRPVAEEGDRT